MNKNGPSRCFYPGGLVIISTCFQDTDTTIYKGSSRTPAVLAGSDSARKWNKHH
jgi:hypothetical protein